ncbi:uncharacterized protein MYCFIDRAFT_134001 [Pseudocercospora fijiensis CIRAD86]|uniref:Amidohydrolase-related domain-containing protein n=1 Tax=Pseudocercospora fijiensis (strain CIRAD86) TaxID=383855 RepID=M3AKT0_PSEFD|nr:uncharacterized protein MYCFIDRAFT_134001 [Pseudocercospora fijiensis CIRAD86]EME85181.1 hypothetical protein MYCFIDRAFT_134001 [Pseudocercospora fijiensis CIRAD86]
MSPPLILKNGTLLTFDEQVQRVRVLRKASILIVGDGIAQIEEKFENLSVPEEVEILDVTGKIISPGFVNTHVHMWMTAYRSVAPDITLLHYFDWVSQTSETAVRAFGPEEVYISTVEGYLEGLNAGVTTVVDHAHCNFGAGQMRRSFEGAVDGGARVWWCYEVSEHGLFGRREQWRKWGEMEGEGLVRFGLAFDAGEGGGSTMEEEEEEEYRRAVRERKVEVFTLHHLGGPWPSKGSSPLDLERRGVVELGVPVILSHAPYLSEDEREWLRKRNFHVSITPESEFHYGHGQTTGHVIADQASLGVDTNFTFSGDVLTQARLWLQRSRDVNFSKLLRDTGLIPRTTPMTAEQGFLMATRQGGRSLWRDDIGVLKVGAKADVVVFNGDSPNMLGWSDAIAAVMLHANVGDIEHVLVGGEFRKRDFQLVNTAVEWDVVRQSFLETAKKVQAHAVPPVPIPDTLWGLKATGDVDVVSTIAST